jgi:N6-adenosine-specific RNA methylase IME4
VRYRTVVVDPPWIMKAGPLVGREGFLDCQRAPSRVLPYGQLTVEEIAAVPVGALAEDDAHLYLWVPNRYAGTDAPSRIIAAWGFAYSTTLVWAKKPMGSGLGGCYGISTEFVLFCRRGTLPALARVGRTSFGWKRPYDARGKPRYSAKPPEFYEMVRSVSPGPRVDVFARGAREHWDVWGDEVESSAGAVEALGAPQRVERP